MRKKNQVQNPIEGSLIFIETFDKHAIRLNSCFFPWYTTLTNKVKKSKLLYIKIWQPKSSIHDIRIDKSRINKNTVLRFAFLIRCLEYFHVVFSFASSSNFSVHLISFVEFFFLSVNIVVVFICMAWENVFSGKNGVLKKKC